MMVILWDAMHDWHRLGEDSGKVIFSMENILFSADHVNHEGEEVFYYFLKI